MLFRMVRPMTRKDSRNLGYIKRIPVDVLARIAGQRLTFRLGDETHSITISPGAKYVKFSLRTHDPVEAKVRRAAVAAHFERVFQALRGDAPTKLTNEQVTALAGRLYRAWTSGEGQERTIAVEQGPDGKMHVVEHDPNDDDVLFEAALMRLVRPAVSGKAIDLDHLPPAEEKPDASDLEPSMGPLIDRLLLTEGIRRVDPPSRGSCSLSPSGERCGTPLSDGCGMLAATTEGAS